MKLRSTWKLIRQVASDYFDDDPLNLAAALSFYTLLSLAPLVLIVVALAGLLFGQEAVEGRVVAEMRGLVGETGAEVIETVIRESSAPGKNTISLVIGIGTLVFSATTVFAELQSALNRIWDVAADPKKSKFWSFVRTRLLSLGMVVGIGFLLLVSLLVSAAISGLGGWLEGRWALSAAIWQAINLVVSLGIVTLLFAMVFKLLPDAKLAWGDVWFGALVTAALFTVGKYLIGLYLGHASLGSSYGAAGSVVVLMVWVYYASLIVFLGAEITKVHSLRRLGRKAPPTEHAVPAAR